MTDNVTLLLVDDLEENLVAMAALLRGPGLRLLKARSGEEALELLLANEVALALVDVQMPGMDGFELAELMRGSVRTKHVPIVFVTAGAHDRKRMFRGYDSGAVDFLYKPIEPHILTNKVAVFVELFRQKQALARDVTERKLAEAVLRNAVDELRSAQRAAERASKAKDGFLAALSHELRTPLTPVLLAAAALREDERLPADAREQLGMMERNIALEARLIDDLLDLTKIAHGKLRFRSEPCDAHHLIGRSVEIVGDDARAKGIIIESTFAAQPSRLMADPARFQQVIWNLLRNAVKFTQQSGRISIRTREDKTTEGAIWLRIEVSDSGIGIDPARLEQIFLPFDQGGLTGDHRFGGVGLGLAIARAVVELHGGRISAQSAGVNRGATFVVELPCVVESPSGISDIVSPASAGSSLRQTLPPFAPLRLLLVEDHESTLQTLSRLLQRDGHRVVTATTVAEALDAAAGNPFDLVISDLGLPDGSGTELMEELRDTYGLRGIALSGYSTEEDTVRSREAGFATHLVKPVAIADLRRAIISLASTDNLPFPVG